MIDKKVEEKINAIIDIRLADANAGNGKDGKDGRDGKGGSHRSSYRVSSGIRRSGCVSRGITRVEI